MDSQRLIDTFDAFFIYSREMALADGVLVDLTEADGMAGHFTYPVACTAAVWSIVEEAVADEEQCNDLAGVLHDIAWMTRFPIHVVDDSTRVFAVIIGGRERELKIVCGPGDDLAPVLTIMFPEED